MFDNGRVWAPRPQTLPVKPAHALLSKGPKQGVEIALKVREKKNTHTQRQTHTDIQKHAHGHKHLIHPRAAVSEAKVVNRCDIKLLITLVLVAKVRWCNTQGIKLCWNCPIYVTRMEVALYLRNSQCHYAVTVSFISPPRFTFIYLSLCLSFCTIANGGHVYSTMRIWCFIKKKKKKKKEAKSLSVVSCNGDWNAKNDLRTCSKGLTRQLFLKVLQLEDFKKLSLANRDVINSGRPGIGKIKGLHSSRFPLSCRLPFPQAWLNLNGIWI